MSTHGPSTGSASLIQQQRERARALELGPEYPGIRATADVVARLSAAKVRLALGAQSVTLRVGDAPAKAYGASDVDLLLALCAEAFERYDAL